jgi:hypothetical protein
MKGGVKMEFIFGMALMASVIYIVTSIQKKKLSKEPCGYCGTSTDPEVICKKCWSKMEKKNE